MDEQLEFMATSPPQFNALFEKEGNGSNGDFCSDVYLSYHMDEVPVEPEFENFHGENLENFMVDDIDLGCKKDMDLMELISSYSSQEYSNNYFGRSGSDSSFT